MRFIRS